MNLIKWYKFEINGKKAIIAASSILAAVSMIENEGYTNYSYQGEV